MTAGMNACGELLCEALDIDPKSIRSITLHVEANQVPRVTIVRIVQYDDMPRLREVIEQYELTRRTLTT